MKTALVPIAILCTALATGGCQVVDTDGLEPLEGHTEWYRVDNTGEVPGHGDGYRVIYVNEVARSHAHAGAYPLGSVIVKEVRKNDGGTPGELEYVAIMRRLAEAPDGGELDGTDQGTAFEGGWLFTRTAEVGDEEILGFTCWDSCHVQAPHQGAWFDYGRGAGAL